MIDRLLTQTEVAARLGCSPKTLQNLRRARKIDYVQFGHRTIRFRESDLERYIAKHRKPLDERNEVEPEKVQEVCA